MSVHSGGMLTLLNWAKYRNIHDPRELSVILQKAEAELADRLHPDPYRRECCSMHDLVTVMNVWYIKLPRPSMGRNGACSLLVIKTSTYLLLLLISGNGTSRYVQSTWRSVCIVRLMNLRLATPGTHFRTREVQLRTWEGAPLIESRCTCIIALDGVNFVPFFLRYFLRMSAHTDQFHDEVTHQRSLEARRP